MVCIYALIANLPVSFPSNSPCPLQRRGWIGPPSGGMGPLIPPSVMGIHLEWVYKQPPTYKVDKFYPYHRVPKVGYSYPETPPSWLLRNWKICEASKWLNIFPKFWGENTKKGNHQLGAIHNIESTCIEGAAVSSGCSDTILQKKVFTQLGPQYWDHHFFKK